METEGATPQDRQEAREPKNIVVLCDGTGNEVLGDLSNVLKLFRIVRKDARQRVYYDPGVGTVGEDDEWRRRMQKLKGVFGLATGAGLDDNVLEAYRFLANVYEKGDRIYLFGFSRGAYTVRALAGFIHMIGLLRPDQVNIADYALTAYKRSGHRHEKVQRAAVRNAIAGLLADRSPEPAGDRQGDGESPDHKGFEAAWAFGRATAARHVTIHFVGVWDTVASMVVPNGLTFQLRTLPFTRRNPSVRAFRHAMAIDERRRMFRLNRWDEGQPFVKNPFATPEPEILDQDCEQLWFCGVHSDVGGSYAEKESGLSKLPLIWMVEEAKKQGLRTNEAMFKHLACGIPREGATHEYVPPDPCGPMHVSLKGFWKFLEIIPKSTWWREWSRGFLGYYLPLAEPRVVEPGAKLHWSVEKRLACPATPSAGRPPGLIFPPYAPINLNPRRERQPRESRWASLGRLLLGIPMLALVGAPAALAIWCWWRPALTFLGSLGLATLVFASAALLLLLVAALIGLVGNVGGSPEGERS
ncbi:MAG TPA: DUF2235 domain-containing protein [Allosphingosinicella sp.]|jgi:uncharacterized protein (DUF2235 family)